MRRVVVLGALIVLAGLIPVLSGSQPPKETWGDSVMRSVAKAPKNLTLNKVRDNMYVTYGGGGNTTIFVAEAGVVIVDTNWPGFGEAILNQVKSVTSKPVTTIINTHTHGDHTGSNAEFLLSVNRVAHEVTKANMERGDSTQAPMPDFKGDKAKFLPKTTFRDRMTLFSGQDRIDLYYFGRGHTGGDTVLVWPALRVAQVGDLFPASGTRSGVHLERPARVHGLLARVFRVRERSLHGRADGRRGGGELEDAEKIYDELSKSKP